MSAANKYGAKLPASAKSQVKQLTQSMQKSGVSAPKDASQPTSANPTPNLANKYGGSPARGRSLAQEKGKQGPSMGR